MSKVNVIYLPSPDAPFPQSGTYLGDAAYVVPEEEHNCWEWTIHTERENGVHHVTLGRREMELLIQIYNDTRKP